MTVPRRTATTTGVPGTWHACVVVTAVLLAACGAREGTPADRGDTVRGALVDAPTRVSPPHVTPLAEDDPAWRAAVAGAHATVRVFLDRLRVPTQTPTMLAAQVRLTEGDVVEHVWLDSLHDEGSILSGTLNDDPARLAHVRRGTRVRVSPPDLLDWVVIDDRRFCGGYTMRLERRRLSAAARDSMDRDFGDVRVPDDSSVCVDRR